MRRPPHPILAVRLTTALALLAASLCVLLATPLVPVWAPAVAHGAALAEEFNGPAGAPPNPAVWSFDTGGAWGSGQELQSYTESPQNASLDGRGDLVITARPQTFTGADGITRQYTSARLETAGKLAFTYGRIAARIRVPSGAGLWPAFWALGGSSYATDSWPASGEIDVLELLGAHPSVAYGTLHGPSAHSSSGYEVQGAYRARSSLAGGFHVYSADWTPHVIRFAVDGHTYRTVTSREFPRGASWPFDHPFFLVLNLAVGGTWGGAPTPLTPWPARMLVDWVHVTPAGAATQASASGIVPHLARSARPQ